MDKQLTVGIAGVAGAGKDTIALLLQADYSMKRMALADPLKEACAALYGIPLSNFHDRSVKESFIEYYRASPRTIVQDFGKLIRDRFGADFWIRRLEFELLQKQYGRICISDIRYQNEIDWVSQKTNGFILHVLRPGLPPIHTGCHESEMVDTLDFDPEYTYQVINDGSISDLQSNIKEVMLKITERVAVNINEDPTSLINSKVL